MILCLVDIGHTTCTDLFQYFVSVSYHHSYLNHVYLSMLRGSLIFVLSGERINQNYRYVISAAVLVGRIDQSLCSFLNRTRSLQYPADLFIL